MSLGRGGTEEPTRRRGMSGMSDAAWQGYMTFRLWGSRGVVVGWLWGSHGVAPTSQRLVSEPLSIIVSIESRNGTNDWPLERAVMTLPRESSAACTCLPSGDEVFSNFSEPACGDGAARRRGLDV